jgi:hypothetical protein
MVFFSLNHVDRVCGQLLGRSYLPLASPLPGWCCLINGVICNATRIVSLALTSIPGQAGLPLPQSLSSLTMLITLDLSSNKFVSAGACRVSFFCAIRTPFSSCFFLLQNVCCCHA